MAYNHHQTGLCKWKNLQRKSQKQWQVASDSWSTMDRCDFFCAKYKNLNFKNHSPLTMADEANQDFRDNQAMNDARQEDNNAGRPNPAIPQDRPEINQGRNGYHAIIERIMRIVGCMEEEARTIFGQRGYLAARNNHGAARVERLGRGHIDDRRRLCMRDGCNNMQMSLNNPLCRECSMTARSRRG